MQDTSNWIDNIISGAGAKFSIKLRFSLNSLGTFVLAGKLGASPVNERQFQVLCRPNGDLEFFWYGALDGSNFRGVRATGVVSASVAYVLDITYNGEINTGDGLGRIAMYLNGVALSTFIPGGFSVGALSAIALGPAPLSVGASVQSSNQINSFAADGKFSGFALYNYIINSSQIGVF